MGKLIILVIILLLGVLALFAISNNDPTTINVPFDRTYEIPKIGLILISSIFGAFSMLLIFVIRDTKRFMATYQFQKKQKKFEKIQSLYSRAVNAVLAHDEPGARSALEDILKVEAGHTDALLRLGDIAASREQFEESEGYYKRALESDPKSLEARFCLQNIMERTEKWPEALVYAEEILDIDPDNLSALYGKRSLLERECRWDDVIEVQKDVLKHEHDSDDRKREQFNLLGYKYELARASLEKGELEKASKIFRSILREDASFVSAHLGIAEVMLISGESESAASFLEKAYEQTGAQIILARIEDLLINLGEPSRLIRTYRQAISENPDDDMLKFLLGKLYYRLEMIDDAFEALFSIGMPDAFMDYYRLLGELYLRRDQCGKALEEFKKTPGLDKPLRLPYCCSVCNHFEDDWTGRCPKCGSWNTFQFNLHGACKG
jgi:lipopolysaccharide biosynthesis regulator YciM